MTNAAFNTGLSISEDQQPQRTDTLGATRSDTMRATSQVHDGVYRLEGGTLSHTPTLDSTKIGTAKDPLEASAQSASGWGKADMKDPNTLVTINGVQAPLGFFESMGLLEQDAKGSYVPTEEAPNMVQQTPEATIEENPDTVIEPFHPQIETEVQHFVNGLHPVAFDGAMSQAIDAIVSGHGEVDIETLAKVSGKDVDSTHDEMVKVLIANKTRAHRLLSEEGVPDSDYDEALHWAQKEEPQKLSKALRQLMVNRNGNAIRQLARSYQHAKTLQGYQR